MALAFGMIWQVPGFHLRRQSLHKNSSCFSATFNLSSSIANAVEGFRTLGFARHDPMMGANGGEDNSPWRKNASANTTHRHVNINAQPV